MPKITPYVSQEAQKEFVQDLRIKANPHMIAVMRSYNGPISKNDNSATEALSQEMERQKVGKIKQYFPAISKAYLKKFKYIDGKRVIVSDNEYKSLENL